MLLEMKVERYMPHTTDDDDRRYRSPEEVEEGRRRDPIDSLQSYLLEAELLTPEQDSEIRDHARREVNAATDDAEAAPFPHPSTVYDHVYRG
jgi:2-oxoisovalerate dehydrogenase E1 component alpha subunit